MSNPELSDEEAELGVFGSEAEEERPKDTEAIEDDEEKRRIDPSAESKKRVNRGPQPKLDAERLKGPKGIQTIEKYFQGFKFHGKGHEKQDLDRVMKRLEHWSYRLFPKLQFDDCLEKIERVGAKKELQVFLKKYRLGMLTEDDEIAPDAAEEERQDSEPIDEFDRLLGEEIEKRRSASAALPAPSLPAAVEERASSASSSLTDEVRERIERNRLEAIEKRRARWLKQQEEEERKRSEESGSTQISESDEVVPSRNADGSSRENENLTSQTDVLDIAERNRLAAIKRREERMREAEERRRNEAEALASISKNDNNYSGNRPAAVSPAQRESSRTETAVPENREMQNSREAEGSSIGEVGLVETESKTDTAISAADHLPIRTGEETSTGATERNIESAEISETVENWGEEIEGDLPPRKSENATKNGISRENISPETSLATGITASPPNKSWESPEDAKRDSPQSGAKKRLLTREELRMEVEDALDRLISPKYRRTK